jgi:hypothetical protein
MMVWQDNRDKNDLEQRFINKVNVDTALMRFEFVQCLVRLAIAKYIRNKDESDVSTAVERFFAHDMLTNLPPEALRDPDAFRRNRLYKTEVDAVLRKYEEPLQVLFRFYAAPDDYLGQVIRFAPSGERKVASTPRMSTDEWCALLRDAKLLAMPVIKQAHEEGEEACTEEEGRNGQISSVHARLCLVASIAFCSDECAGRGHQPASRDGPATA